MEFDKLDDGRARCPFDHHTAEFAANYFAILDEVRTHSPLVWSDRYGGFWVATGHNVVRKLMVNSSAVTVDHGPDHKGGIFIPPGPGAGKRPTFVPGEVEGAEHDRFRLALNPYFSKARIAELAPMIERHVAGVIDRLLDLGEFDVVEDFVASILAAVACEMLGFEVDNPRRFFLNIAPIIEFLGPENHDFEAALGPFTDAWKTVTQTVANRREQPRDDVISKLVQDPADFTDDEVQRMVLNIILGAGDTTSAMMGQAMMYLYEHADVRDFLTANPDQVRAAVEEFLRMFAVAMAPCRTVTREIEIEGVTLRPGDRLLLSLPGANHDPSAYPNPYAFDLQRGSHRHLAMGVGTHFCLGSHLAKAISEEAIKQFLTKVPNFTVDVERAVSNSDKAAINSWEFIPAKVVAHDQVS